MSDRTEIAIATAGINDEGTVTATSVSSTGSFYIDLDEVRDERLTIRLYGGTSEDLTATFKAGDFSDNSIGDLEVEFAAAATKVITLESARFKDSDEYILIDIATTTTGTYGTGATIEVYENE